MSPYLSIADLVDVALVALLVFAFLTLVRRSASKRLIRSLATLFVLFALLYGLGRAYDLYLVQRIVEGLSVVLAASVIVVFQSDLRRLIDSVPSITSLFSSASSEGNRTDHSQTIDALTETVAACSEKRIGALIAIQGNEPWDRHIHGGVPVEGRVSSSLLLSIFNPASPTHDGAVLIGDDRILQCGVHLPLSSDLTSSPNLGTRHAAALGLADQCDALVLVVSEERGTISVARNGRLTSVSSSGEVTKRLVEFEEQTSGTSPSGSRSKQSTRTWRTLGVSVAVSVILWFLFAYNPDVIYRTLEIPVELQNVPDTIVVNGTDPAAVRATLVGSRQAFATLRSEEVSFSIDLARLQDTTTIVRLTEASLDLPSEIELYRVDPADVALDMRTVTSMYRPIRIATTGTVPDSLRLVSHAQTGFSKGASQQF